MLYTQPFTLSATTTVKAIAVKTGGEHLFFSATIIFLQKSSPSYRKLSYFCSPMRYLMKPSDKNVCWESTDSTNLISLFPHIGGQSIGRLFFVETTN
jgi:hypothetical protein